MRALGTSAASCTGAAHRSRHKPRSACRPRPAQGVLCSPLRNGLNLQSSQEVSVANQMQTRHQRQTQLARAACRPHLLEDLLGLVQRRRARQQDGAADRLDQRHGGLGALRAALLQVVRLCRQDRQQGATGSGQVPAWAAKVQQTRLWPRHSGSQVAWHCVHPLTVADDHPKAFVQVLQAGARPVEM